MVLHLFGKVPDFVVRGIGLVVYINSVYGINGMGEL